MNIFNSVVLITLLSINTFAESNQHGYFLRNADGTLVTRVSLLLAENLCCMENGLSEEKCWTLDSKEKFELNVRLSTAKELAIEAEEYGAVVRELGKDPSDKPEGFDLIVAKNPDGIVDQFYYSVRKYRGPSEEFKRHHAYSSSVYLNPYYKVEHFMHLRTGIFGLLDNSISQKAPVIRCVVSSGVTR